MVAYATQADLQSACGGLERLTQLTDWDKDRIPDAAEIVIQIEKASAWMNSYFAKQRYVPMAAPYPPVVVDVCARVTRYRIASARGMVTEQERTDFEDDEKWLTGVAEGTIKLDVEPQPQAASDRIDGFSERPGSKDISRRKLWGFS